MFHSALSILRRLWELVVGPLTNPELFLKIKIAFNVLSSQNVMEMGKLDAL